MSPQKRAFSANRWCQKMRSVCGCIVLYLCHFILAPEAGVVEWCVPMLVDCIGVRFALNQLAHTGDKVRKMNNKARFQNLRRRKQRMHGPVVATLYSGVCVYLGHDVSVSVTGGEMQWGVIAAIHHVNAGASHDEHVNNAAPPFPACPVEGAEAMVVTETQDSQRINSQERQILNLSPINLHLKI